MEDGCTHAVVRLAKTIGVLESAAVEGNTEVDLRGARALGEVPRDGGISAVARDRRSVKVGLVVDL